MREDWPEVLAAAIKEARGRQFVWGEYDCCLFVADIVQEITGTDYMADFRGKYNSASGAAQALNDYGQGTIRATTTALLGPELPPAMARRGDAVLANAGNGDTMGICVGSTAAYLTEIDGLRYIPISQCICCWRTY